MTRHYDFFARSPSIYTILPPLRVVVKLCKLRENVQKSHSDESFCIRKWPAVGPSDQLRGHDDSARRASYLESGQRPDWSSCGLRPKDSRTNPKYFELKLALF